MRQFKLRAGDILVNINCGKDPWSRTRRWAVGSPYSHALLYMGELRLIVHRRQGEYLRFPMLFESNGRGAVLQSLSNRYGQEVVVLRLKPEYQRKIPRVLTEAVKLASHPQAHYDYFVIVWHIIPKIIFEKLGLTPPLKYQRNERQICSEACAEVFWRAKIEVVPKDVVPLPSSFVESELLDEAGRGILSEEWL